MPIYEYSCKACGVLLQRLTKMGDPSCPPCPECGEETTKVFSVPALQFVGNGFYKTDYRKPDSGGKGE